MITVEYYWDNDWVRGLLATYTMKGDGTPGTVEIEPFSKRTWGGARGTEVYRLMYDFLVRNPGAIMEVDLEEHQVGKEWTLELAQEQCQAKFKAFRGVIIEPGTPKGTSDPVPPRQGVKVRVVPKEELKSYKRRNDWERKPDESEAAFERRIAQKRKRMAAYKRGAARRANNPPRWG